MDALGGNFGAKVGIFDPDDVVADTAAFSATDKSSPRVEAQITYNGGIGDLGINLWVDGTYQNTERNEAQAAARNTQDAAGTMTNVNDGRDTDVDSAGVGFGTKVSYQGFAIVASGFYGNALGIRGQRTFGASTSVGALDDVGTERKTYGGYLQGTYDFGQGTSAGYSYGGNCLKKTGNDMNTTGVMNCQTMHSGMTVSYTHLTLPTKA